MTLVEVTRWYRRAVGNIESWVDKPLPLSEQVKEAKRINEFIMKSVKSAVYSQSAYQEFVAAAGAAIPSRSTMRAWKASPEFSGMTGQKQLEAILKKYTEIKLPVQKYEPACFAGGTLVHTKNGLVPIEQIKVGDWVLSKHESGEGEREYKRVTQTFAHEDRPVNRIYLKGDLADGTERQFEIAVTSEHPIWVQGKGWKEAGKLKGTYPSTELELLIDGYFSVMDNLRLFKTDHPDIAWSPLSSVGSWLGCMGKRIHIPSMEVVETDVFIGIDYVRSAKRAKPEHLYTTTVYNLEVEDFHTYYVGEAGIWVHNKNVQVSASAAPGYIPTASDLSRPFISRGELSNDLNKLAGQGAEGYKEATHKA